jgi:hypothetical protein
MTLFDCLHVIYVECGTNMFQLDAKDGNAMKKLKLSLLAAKIEWHWLFIKRTRKRGNSLLGIGIPLSSPRFIKLNCSLASHSAKVIRNQMVYEELEKAINS